MRILAIHADFLKYEPKKKAIGAAEDVKPGMREVRECLVVFTAVEKKDEENESGAVDSYVNEVKDIAGKVNTKSIVLYPYAHLSPDLSKPSVAVNVMRGAEEKLKKEGYVVERAPFGWYKAFDIACKGHPLSELARSFGPGEAKKQDVSEAVEKEKKLKSTWYVVDKEGKLHEISENKGRVEGYDFSKYKKLEKFAAYEISKVRASQQEPPHVKYMRALELVDYEPGSDPGNLRYYPKGRLIKALLEAHVTSKMHSYGAMEIEAPIMYDYEHPALKSYMNRFPARQYTIQTPNKKVFLRFAACFGQFLMAHDMNISYKDLPMKLYEMTRYSFRVEQRGELTGLRRLRAFTMPDCHAFCKDFDSAKAEMMKRFRIGMELQKEMGLEMPDDLEGAIRITKEFYEKNKDFIREMVNVWGKPMLLEMWEERFFYFVMKYDWNFVDASDKASALSTDQIDIENGPRYGIKYTDTDGSKKDVMILHQSPSGAIERVMYALLEKAYFQQLEKKNPTLPLWLAPTQIRVMPVSNDKHSEYCEKIAKELSERRIRADIDDTEETVSKKIRNAEKEWVPYILVIGDKEIKGGQVNVRIRESSEQKEMEMSDLVAEVKEKTSGMPYIGLPLPKLLSKRPKFVG
ncbi:MAG: threonine--tRNA ligase [Candidatus Woesearchaeota archaeon]